MRQARGSQHAARTGRSMEGSTCGSTGAPTPPLPRPHAHTTAPTTPTHSQHIQETLTLQYTQHRHTGSLTSKETDPFTHDDEVRDGEAGLMSATEPGRRPRRDEGDVHSSWRQNRERSGSARTFKSIFHSVLLTYTYSNVIRPPRLTSGLDASNT